MINNWDKCYWKINQTVIKINFGYLDVIHRITSTLFHYFQFNKIFCKTPNKTCIVLATITLNLQNALFSMDTDSPAL